MSRELARKETEGLPPWLRAMREAAMDAVSTSDVTEMVKCQVEKAKKGDRQALQFVFDKILGGDQLKGATFVQQNFYGEDDPTKPTPARPGTNGKLVKMQARAAAGMPLCDKDDGPSNVDLR
jgi:hypothetical protein